MGGEGCRAARLWHNHAASLCDEHGARGKRTVLSDAPATRRDATEGRWPLQEARRWKAAAARGLISVFSFPFFKKRNKVRLISSASCASSNQQHHRAKLIGVFKPAVISALCAVLCVVCCVLYEVGGVWGLGGDIYVTTYESPRHDFSLVKGVLVQ